MRRASSEGVRRLVLPAIVPAIVLALTGCLPDSDVEPPETTGDELIIGSDGAFEGERKLDGDDDLLLIDSDGRIDTDDPY